ncbi:hypothetical protein JCM4814A_90360 [Streptomyces phaeofaciens JCM 4814]
MSGWAIRGEVADVPDVAGSHLQDQEVCGHVGHRDGQGETDLVVVGLRRGYHVAGQHLGDEVLRARLAGRAGDGHDLRAVESVVQETATEPSERGEDVVDHDRGDADRPGDQGCCGALVDGRLGVGVTVGVLALEGDEQ